VKQLEYDFKEEKLIFLKPKLAYIATKAGELGAKALRTVLDASIDEVKGGDGDKKAKFERFVNFFEAILAYHKAAGGK
jgi:CRISPR-associated protein Csm2